LTRRQFDLIDAGEVGGEMAHICDHRDAEMGFHQVSETRPTVDAATIKVRIHR